MSNLSRCPFCGSPPTQYHKSQWLHIACRDCDYLMCSSDDSEVIERWSKRDLSTVPDAELLAELQRPERARLVCKAMEHVIDAGLDEQVPDHDQRGDDERIYQQAIGESLRGKR